MQYSCISYVQTKVEFIQKQKNYYFSHRGKLRNGTSPAGELWRSSNQFWRDCIDSDPFIRQLRGQCIGKLRHDPWESICMTIFVKTVKSATPHQKRIPKKHAKNAASPNFKQAGSVLLEAISADILFIEILFAAIIYCVPQIGHEFSLKMKIEKIL